MAQPLPYNRAFNFSNFQSENPTSPLPANKLDEELSRLKAVTDQIRSVIRLIQRDDTTLANATVGFDQLKTEIEIGVNPPTTWATTKNYIERDTVFHEQKFYICLESHISGTFSTDLSAGKWEEIADFTAAQTASLVVYDNSTSGLTATNMQDAMDELVASVLVTSVHGRVGDVVGGAGDYDADQVNFAPAGLAHTDAIDVQSAIADHDVEITVWGVPTGATIDFEGPDDKVPAGYLLCAGQAVSRATYARLFAVIGTTHGTGDGSTTFNIPDRRGRVSAGKDDMGGTSANRLTNQTGGLDGDVLGATGGAETHTLTTPQLATHTHAGTTDSGGSHTHGGVHTGGTLSGVGIGSPPPFGFTAAPTINGTSDSGGSHTHTFTTGSAGSGAAHNNVQPTAIVNKIIKT